MTPDPYKSLIPGDDPLDRLGRALAAIAIVLVAIVAAGAVVLLLG